RPQEGIRAGVEHQAEYQAQDGACIKTPAAAGTPAAQKSVPRRRLRRRPAWLKLRRHSGWFPTFADAEREYDKFRKYHGRKHKRTVPEWKDAWHVWCCQRSVIEWRAAA